MTANESLRRCILSGQRDERDSLIRLALSPDGLVLPDVAARAPGRGAWLSADRAALEKAISNNKFKGALLRAFKTGPVHWPEDLPERIFSALQKQTLERLGLESRSGALLFGSDRISDAIGAGRVRLLIHAADAAVDGRRKLDGRLLAAAGKKGEDLPVGRVELSLALGRENVVHAALIDRAAAGRVAAVLSRWRAYSGLNDRPELGELGLHSDLAVETFEGVGNE